MLSTETRLRLEEIATKIQNQEEVALSDMIWADKWASHNRSAAAIISKARRIAIEGEAHPDSLDGLLQAMDLGEREPADKNKDQTDPDFLIDFFKSDSNDKMTRD